MGNIELTPSDYINIGCCGVAVVSAIIAVISCVISKKQYKLQVAQFDASKPQYNVSVKKSVLRKQIDSCARYSFDVCISNISDNPTSIRCSSLEIYTLDNARYVFQEARLSRGEIDINIEPHNSFTGEFVFEVPWNIYDVISIEKTFLEFKDIHEVEYKEQVIFIEEKYEEDCF